MTSAVFFCGWTGGLHPRRVGIGQKPENPMKSITRRRFARKDTPLGFQIAPMIDVVFVILLFFMVAAGTQQKENTHQAALPGDKLGTDIQLPDEVVIEVAADGEVFLNDDSVGAPGIKDLKELAANMITLKKAADAAGAPLLVTIQSEEQAKYERIVDVLDSLTRANVTQVTFTTGEQ